MSTKTVVTDLKGIYYCENSPELYKYLTDALGIIPYSVTTVNHEYITLEYLRVPTNAKRQGLCIVGARKMHEDRLNRLVNEATFMLYAINYQQQIEKYHANIE